MQGSAVKPLEHSRRAWIGWGYITSAEFWRNGTVYGIVFLAALIVIGLPLL